MADDLTLVEPSVLLERPFIEFIGFKLLLEFILVNSSSSPADDNGGKLDGEGGDKLDGEGGDKSHKSAKEINVMIIIHVLSDTETCRE